MRLPLILPDRQTLVSGLVSMLFLSHPISLLLWHCKLFIYQKLKFRKWLWSFYFLRISAITFNHQKQFTTSISLTKSPCTSHPHFSSFFSLFFWVLTRIIFLTGTVSPWSGLRSDIQKNSASLFDNLFQTDGSYSLSKVMMSSTLSKNDKDDDNTHILNFFV